MLASDVSQVVDPAGTNGVLLEDALTYIDGCLLAAQPSTAPKMAVNVDLAMLMFQAGCCDVQAGTCDMPTGLLQQIEQTYSDRGWVVTLDEHVDTWRGIYPSLRLS